MSCGILAILVAIRSYFGAQPMQVAKKPFLNVNSLRTSRTGISLVGKRSQLLVGVVLTLHKALLMLLKISTEHLSASLPSTTQQIHLLKETHVWKWMCYTMEKQCMAKLLELRLWNLVTQQVLAHTETQLQLDITNKSGSILQ